MKAKTLGALQAALLLVSVLGAATVPAVGVGAMPQASLSDQRQSKVKSLVRRDARVQELLPKIEARISALRATPATALLAARIEDEVNRIVWTAPGETDARLREDVSLLAAIASDFKPPSSDELKPLQERYSKIARDLDDLVHVKDFDRVLHRHDKLVRYTSLGLWDKTKIESELDKLEQSMASAPDIPYGRSELLRGLQDRKLASVPNLTYVGAFPKEEIYLSGDRRSIALLDEGAGGGVQLETTNFIIQGPDGQLCDLTSPCHPASGVPFAPPLSLWLKARMLEGKIPAVTFVLADRQAQELYKKLGYSVASDKMHTVQDVVAGQLDEYFKRNIDEIANTKEAALVGLFDDFDRETAAYSFGADGKTPFFMLGDAKLAKLPESEAYAEFAKKTQKSGYSKTMVPEWSNAYGDPSVPDGPERVRDAWVRVQKIVADEAKNIAFYSSAGAFHGSKVAYKQPGLELSGAQAWNKLDYYFPGENVLDWIGTAAVGSAGASAKDALTVQESVQPFLAELSGSRFARTPLMLRGVSPASTPDPASEGAWIQAMFQTVIPALSPAPTIVFLSVPEKVTLWTTDSVTSYRTHVAANKNYKWPLRFKMLSNSQ